MSLARRLVATAALVALAGCFDYRDFSVQAPVVPDVHETRILQAGIEGYTAPLVDLPADACANSMPRKASPLATAVDLAPDENATLNAITDILTGEPAPNRGYWNGNRWAWRLNGTMGFVSAAKGGLEWSLAPNPNLARDANATLDLAQRLAQPLAFPAQARIEAAVYGGLLSGLPVLHLTIRQVVGESPIATIAEGTFPMGNGTFERVRFVLHPVAWTAPADIQRAGAALESDAAAYSACRFGPLALGERSSAREVTLYNGRLAYLVRESQPGCKTQMESRMVWLDAHTGAVLDAAQSFSDCYVN